MQSQTGFPTSHQLKSYVAYKSRLKLAARAVLSADAGLLVFLANVTICYRPSVVCLSVVSNVHAPCSDGSNFRQYFYGIRYLGHPLTSTENFTEIVPGEPPPAGGIKHKRDSQI